MYVRSAHTRCKYRRLHKRNTQRVSYYKRERARARDATMSQKLMIRVREWTPSRAASVHPFPQSALRWSNQRLKGEQMNVVRADILVGIAFQPFQATH